LLTGLIRAFFFSPCFRVYFSWVHRFFFPLFFRRKFNRHRLRFFDPRGCDLRLILPGLPFPHLPPPPFSLRVFHAGFFSRFVGRTLLVGARQAVFLAPSSRWEVPDLRSFCFPSHVFFSSGVALKALNPSPLQPGHSYLCDLGPPPPSHSGGFLAQFFLPILWRQCVFSSQVRQVLRPSATISADDPRIPPPFLLCFFSDFLVAQMKHVREFFFF